MRLSVPARLDPVGRLRLPRRGTTLRVVLVAVLLLTAAGVLYSGADAGADAGAGDPRRPGGHPGAAGDPVPGGTAPPGPAIPAGMVGVPVPLGDPTSLAVLRPGHRIDLLSVPPAGEPVPLAGGAPVLAVDHAAAVLLLALTPEQARAVVAASADTRFAVIVRG